MKFTTDHLKTITDKIEGGHTVSFSTPLRVYPVNNKTLNKFKNAGLELFKVSNGSIYMLNGKKYLCIDYTTITFA